MLLDYNLNKSELSELNMWWNSAYRKIFGYNKWESVKELIFLLERLDLHHLVNLRRLLFIKRAAFSSNMVVKIITSQFVLGPEAKTLQDLCATNLSWSASRLKTTVKLSLKIFFHIN